MSKFKTFAIVAPLLVGLTLVLAVVLPLTLGHTNNSTAPHPKPETFALADSEQFQQHPDHTVIAGCVRNCGPYLERVFQNIARLQQVLPVSQIVLAYDVSTDNTLSKLYKLKMKFPLKVLINKLPLSTDRIENLSNARNMCLQHIHSLTHPPKYVIVMDMDDVCAKPMYTQVLKNTLADSANWDCVTFYNQTYYDYMALSVGPFQGNCWKKTNPQQVIQSMHDYLKHLISTTPTDYVKVDSAFNGFGVYKWDKFQHCRYDFRGDMEHRFFHLCGKHKHGARIVIRKQPLFPPYEGEHATFVKR